MGKNGIVFRRKWRRCGTELNWDGRLIKIALGENVAELELNPQFVLEMGCVLKICWELGMTIRQTKKPGK